jgi:3-deoxy-D-manno-octulosonic-acid transferase
VPAELTAQARGLRAGWGARRPVWIAASTHEGEEEAVLRAHEAVLKRFSDALLILVPRHPERFKPVIQESREAGFATRTRSENGTAASDTQCFVVDTLGELLRFYATADVAFVGGSLVPIGGHNILEPAALSVPVVVGPQTFNFVEITASLIDAGAALRIADADELGATVIELLTDAPKRKRLGTAARAAFEREQGGVLRTLEVVGKVLDAPVGEAG